MTLLREHIQTSESLMEQADRAYAQGDVAQALQKSWESVRNALGAIAERRGWKFDTDGEMHRAANMLSKETNQRDIYTLFQVAYIAPSNFEEGWLTDSFIEYDLQAAKRLLAILEDIE